MIERFSRFAWNPCVIENVMFLAALDFEFPVSFVEHRGIFNQDANYEKVGINR